MSPAFRDTFRQVYGGTAEQLKAYQITVAPPRNAWVLVEPKEGIYFMQVCSGVFVFLGRRRCSRVPGLVGKDGRP